MKTFTSLISLLFTVQIAFAQVSTDSITAKIQSVKPTLPDSLKTSWLKIDSVRNDFNTEADSLQNSYHNLLNPVDEQTSRIQHKIDSLNNLALPSNALTRKLDSLQQYRDKIQNEYTSKSQALKSKTLGKLDKVEMTPGMEAIKGELTQKVNSFEPAAGLFQKIPTLEVPGFDASQFSQINGLGKMSGMPDLPGMQTPLGEVGALPDQLQGVGADVKNIANGNLKGVGAIPNALEQQVGKMDGIQELQTGNRSIEKITSLNNPEALKEQAKEMVVKQAVDHFAGKEEALKAAMEQVSKYKAKYSSISSIKDLPKRPPNPMKEKPFIERLVPGIYFQVANQGLWLLDVNPYVGYRLSGRFTSGCGWNHRYAYEPNARLWISAKRIYGPRAFVDFEIGKGFIAHLETELMNTFVPNNIIMNRSEGGREWISSTMLGMKKRYNIYKNLRGTVLVQYNLYDRFFKSPYIDRINSRMGFEYTLKKRPKQ